MDLSSSVDNAIAGKTPSTSMDVFSTRDHSTPTYVRSASLWLSSLASKLTGVSAWNSDGVGTKAGVLVSPRHILFATHFTPANGSTFRFVASDNTIVTRTLSSVVSLSNDSNNVNPDVTVGLLDSDVPTSISFMKVFPSNVTAKLPSLLGVNQLQAVSFNKDAKLSIRNIYLFSSAIGNQIGYTEPNETTNSQFYLPFIGGDSGSPSFVVLNGEPILLSVETTGGAGSGSCLSSIIAPVNSAMSSLGGGYQLTQVDISSYNDL